MRLVDMLATAERKSHSINMKMTDTERAVYKCGYANAMRDTYSMLKHKATYAFCMAHCELEPWNCDKLVNEDTCDTLENFCKELEMKKGGEE